MFVNVQNLIDLLIFVFLSGINGFLYRFAPTAILAKRPISVMASGLGL